MADRTPVDVILPCLNEADVSLPVLLGEDRTGWWSMVPDNDNDNDNNNDNNDDARPGAAEPGAPDADPGRGSYGRGPSAGVTAAGTR
jgi:hypothetical protein